jgi:tRNA modification GTPase
LTDTIIALATPPGISGLSVIRLSGSDAISIADSCFVGKKKLTEVASHTIHYGNLVSNEELIDTVTASVFIEPHSYTGENSVEISCHGSPIVIQEIISLLISHGARSAQPGEFTKRAFLNGKLNLMQVESVADIIHSKSVKGALTAARQLAGNFNQRLSELRQKLLDIASLLELELDFADEDIDLIEKDRIINQVEESITYCKDLSASYKSSEILRSGYFIGIAGYPNSGKSTLFNALLQKTRAIVSHIPGTTRDYIEETLFLDGLSVKIIDTAGIRETDDVIEIEGIKLVESVLGQSNMIIILNDISISQENSDNLKQQISVKYPESEVILVHNKIDSANIETTNSENIFHISAKKSIGIEELKTFITEKAKQSTERVKDILINQRHVTLLNQVVSELENANFAINSGLDNTAVAIDIRRATKAIGEITGEIWSEDVLNNIFSRFCIGK